MRNPTCLQDSTQLIEGHRRWIYRSIRGWSSSSASCNDANQVSRCANSEQAAAQAQSRRAVYCCGQSLPSMLSGKRQLLAAQVLVLVNICPLTRHSTPTYELSVAVSSSRSANPTVLSPRGVLGASCEGKGHDRVSRKLSSPVEDDETRSTMVDGIVKISEWSEPWRRHPPGLRMLPRPRRVCLDRPRYTILEQ